MTIKDILLIILFGGLIVVVMAGLLIIQQDPEVADNSSSIKNQPSTSTKMLIVPLQDIHYQAEIDRISNLELRPSRPGDRIAVDVDFFIYNLTDKTISDLDCWAYEGTRLLTNVNLTVDFHDSFVAGKLLPRPNQPPPGPGDYGHGSFIHLTDHQASKHQDILNRQQIAVLSRRLQIQCFNGQLEANFQFQPNL